VFLNPISPKASSPPQNLIRQHSPYLNKNLVGSVTGPSDGSRKPHSILLKILEKKRMQ
jgi:hypothetical protein